MFPTKNDLPEKARGKLIELLSDRLADAIDLQLQAKQAHWNVKGPSFIALHELFDDVYGGAAGYVDLIAERIVQLGGVARGTIATIAQKTSLAPYPSDISKGPDHVAALSTALAQFGKVVRESIAHSDELGDADTADLFTEVSRGVDKHLWFVEAHAH